MIVSLTAQLVSMANHYFRSLLLLNGLIRLTSFHNYFPCRWNQIAAKSANRQIGDTFTIR